jgi:hypothetical protein
MARPRVVEKLDIPAERVWALVSDFGNTSWFPGTTAEVQGQGPGMSRLIRAGDGPAIREQLDSVDPARRTLTYRIPENNPLPVTDYRATISVRPLGPGSCEIEWVCECKPKGVSEAQAVGAVEGMYRMMVGWLRDALR